MAYAEVLTALADPTRRSIFEALGPEPMSVTELAKGQPVSRPAVSQHLRVLESANLVSVQPKGTRRLYLVKREGLEDLRSYLDTFWTEALSAYGAEVRRRADQRTSATSTEKGLEEAMSDTYEPIVKTIDVPTDQKEAFEVFLHEMGTWWPLQKFSASAKFGKTATGLRVEPKVGGTIVETSADRTEHLWGTIKALEPYNYVSMDFHIGLPKETASLVEVRFVKLSPDRTRVELTQSEWERFGDFAEMMRHGYPKGWIAIFDEAYRLACEAR